MKCLTLEKPMAGTRDRVQRRPSAEDKPAQPVRSRLALDEANRCRGNESNPGDPMRRYLRGCWKTRYTHRLNSVDCGCPREVIHMYSRACRENGQGRAEG